MTVLNFPVEAARRLVATALAEDLGLEGLEVTSSATIPADQVATGHVLAREPGVLAGAPVIALVLDGVASLTGGTLPSIEVLIADGERIDAGPSCAGEVRRARRGWHQQADGALRRRDGQGQPRRGRRRSGRRVRLDPSAPCLEAGSRFLMCDNMSGGVLRTTVETARAWVSERGESVKTLDLV